MTRVHLVNSGAICAIGIGTAQCSAAFRAGLSGYVQSALHGRCGEPLTMALVPELDLEPLSDALLEQPLGDRERRMLRLGGAALRQVSDHVERPLPMFLALPEPEPGKPAHSGRGFLEHLATQAALPLAIDTSRYFELGRAGGLYALQAALDALRAGQDSALVCGIETCLDLPWVARLDHERRLLGPDVKDGFVPGEGAAVLHLSRTAVSGASLIAAVGTAEDLGHRYSEAPALGVGLANALEDARARLPALEPVRTCFAGLNGEAFGAKEWGVAHIRHHDLFDRELAFEHPADCFGDVGAAMGPLLIALADETLRSGHRAGPMLIWASSDHAPCACAYLAAGGTL